jgi:hypothetical protein
MLHILWKEIVCLAFQGLFDEKKTLQNSITACFTAKRVLGKKTNCFVMEVKRFYCVDSHSADDVDGYLFRS